uniref:DUF6443 domain-containing protein n=1 Tax=Bacteroides sp. UBA939 TaxID=1946092 RepID=UPI0025C54CCF
MKRIYTLIVILGLYATVCAQVSTQNYVQTRTMLNETGSSYMDNVVYFDGLGRSFQTVQKGITPTDKQNLVTLQEYDALGRETSTWLPIKSTSTFLAPATFKSNAPGNYSDARPYSEPVYESSPLNRVIKQHGPGKAWETHPVVTSYMTNTLDASMRCIHYLVDANGGLVRDAATYYPAGELYVTKTTDEDNNVSYTFTDKDGCVLLSRKVATNVAHDTYYVYDDLGNLRYVLQPMYQDNNNLALYAFQYKYDDRSRCVWKKLPGIEPVEYWYDDADRLTYSQDGNQRVSDSSLRTYYLYDKFNRLTEQGETRILNNRPVFELHFSNYYDGYEFLSSYGFTDAAYSINADDKKYGKGMLTGSAIAIGNSHSMIYTAYHYDIKGRVVKSISSNLLGGYETTTTTYTFTGQPATVTHTHTATGKATQTEVYTYTYDHADRVSKVEHKLNGTTVTLVDNTYDAFGRLSTKSL